MVVGKSDAESAALLANPDNLRAIGAQIGMADEAVNLVTGVLQYGPVQLKYAHHFLAVADPENKRPTDEFFRRFVQYVFPKVRGWVYAGMRPETWQAYDQMCTRYTRMRMRDLGFIPGDR